jgi:hypothetical protein
MWTQIRIQESQVKADPSGSGSGTLQEREVYFFKFKHMHITASRQLQSADTHTGPDIN